MSHIPVWQSFQTLECSGGPIVQRSASHRTGRHRPQVREARRHNCATPHPLHKRRKHASGSPLIVHETAGTPGSDIMTKLIGAALPAIVDDLARHMASPGMCENDAGPWTTSSGVFLVVAFALSLLSNDDPRIPEPVFLYQAIKS